MDNGEDLIPLKQAFMRFALLRAIELFNGYDWVDIGFREIYWEKRCKKKCPVYYSKGRESRNEESDVNYSDPFGFGLDHEMYTEDSSEERLNDFPQRS
jgi:hypothetical protein